MCPQLEGKVTVGDAEPTDEVIFECLDGAFSSVNSVVIGFDKLDQALALLQVLLDGGTGLIIRDVELWFVSFGREGVVNLCECRDD